MKLPDEKKKKSKDNYRREVNQKKPAFGGKTEPPPFWTRKRRVFLPA